MIHIPQEELKKTLLGSGFIDQGQYDAAENEAVKTDRDIAHILIEHGDISEEYLAEILAGYFGVEFVRLKKLKIDEEVIKAIPEQVAKIRRVIAFSQNDTDLKVAMEDPGDLDTIKFLTQQTNKKIIPYITTPSDLKETLGLYKESISSDFSKIINENIKKSNIHNRDINQMAKDLPVINILNVLLEYAVSERASDIHLERLPNEFIVRFRVDGTLKDIISLPPEVHPAIVARIKILADLKIDEHRLPQDGRFRFEKDNFNTAIRVSIIPAFYGEKVVMRLLEESGRVLSLEEIGLSQKNLALVEKSINQPHGMLLVTGPTGSGKTTTLYTILHMLNRPEVNISTVEDPIEYDIKRINQIQINPKINLTFAEGLRSLLRQDPDIMMVGEIRDQETAQIAIHSALTGHLLLSTLHTNDAVGAIPRLIDMGIEPFLLASTLNLIVAQRLVRRICTNCVSVVKLTEEDKKKYLQVIGGQAKTLHFPTQVYKGNGCDQCNQTGYKGRIGIFEILEKTPQLEELIATGATEEKIKAEATRQGMTTMLEDGFMKAESGITTLDEVLRVTRE